LKDTIDESLDLPDEDEISEDATDEEDEV